MRLFVAIELDAAVKEETTRVIGELRRRAERVAPHARITWVAGERQHLTVRFLGAIEESRVDAICEALAPPLPIAPFDTSIAGTGAFPPSGPPRVLWAGVGSGRPQLLDVERHTTARLSAVGIPPEARGFNPHLTLARVRVPAGLRTKALFEGFADHSFGGSHVSAITLFESRLSPKGPTYRVVQQTALRAG